MIFDINSQGDRDIVKSQADSGLSVGLTSGCFDLFHNLHLIYLQKCRRRCEFLIVGIDSDRMVKEFKGADRPVIPEQQRAVMVAALECVNAAFIMDDVSDFARASHLGAGFLFKNEGFSRDGEEGTIGVVGAENAEVIIIPDVSMPDSTSRIIEDIITRKQEESNGHAESGTS